MKRRGRPRKERCIRGHNDWVAAPRKEWPNARRCRSCKKFHVASDLFQDKPQ